MLFLKRKGNNHTYITDYYGSFIPNSIWAGNDWSGPAMVALLQDLRSCNKFWSFAWTALLFLETPCLFKTC